MTEFLLINFSTDMNVSISQGEHVMLKETIRIRTSRSACQAKHCNHSYPIKLTIGFKYIENEEHEIKYSYSSATDALYISR